MKAKLTGRLAKFSLLYEICLIATLTLSKSRTMQNKQQHQNQIDHYRRRMRFRASHVARLLGHQDGSTLSEYERGNRLPSLVNALRLGIILRVPVEFLFPNLYDQMRNQIRAEEERLAAPSQPTLF